MKSPSKDMTLSSLLAIIIMASMPLFIITALNVLFMLGIPYNVMTYLAAFLLYYIARPAVVRPPDTNILMTLSDGSQQYIPQQKMQPKKSHLTVVKSDNDNEPPKAS